jgi:hypothetical protein
MFDKKLICDKSIEIIKKMKCNNVPLNGCFDVTFNSYETKNKKELKIFTLNEIENFNFDIIKNIYEPSKIVLVVPKSINYKKITTSIFILCIIENVVVDDLRYLVIRPKRKFEIPKFDLIDRKVKVLLCDMAGYGDFFNMLRYLQFYKDVEWTLEARPSLVELAKNSKLFKNVIVKDGSEHNHNCSFYITNNDLYEKFKSSYITIPFLKLGDITEKQNDISFCYKGNIIKVHNRREYNPEIIKDLSSSYSMCNLQVDEPDLPWANNCKNEIKNWYDTALILKKSKLVICTATSMVHLAGALGIPTMVIYNKSLLHEKLYFEIKNKISPFYPKNLIIVNENNCKKMVVEYFKFKHEFIIDLLKQKLLL